MKLSLVGVDENWGVPCFCKKKRERDTVNETVLETSCPQKENSGTAWTLDHRLVDNAISSPTENTNHVYSRLTIGVESALIGTFSSLLGSAIMSSSSLESRPVLSYWYSWFIVRRFGWQWWERKLCQESASLVPSVFLREHISVDDHAEGHSWCSRLTFFARSSTQFTV